MSGLRQVAKDYLAIRRTLGFKLIDHGRLVVQFVDYLEDVGAAVITTAQALAWLQLRTTASPFRQRRRLGRSVSSLATCNRSIRGRKSRRRSCYRFGSSDRSPTCTRRTRLRA